MKYSPLNYAKAFIGVITDAKSESEREKLTRNFVKIIERNGDMKKGKKMMETAEREYSKTTGKRKVLFETARKIEPSSRERFKHLLKEDDFVEEKINPSLIAGIRITINGEDQLDQSFERKIETLLK